MISIGKGAQINSQNQIQSSGSNLINIFASQNTKTHIHDGGTTTTLTVQDSKALKENCKHLLYTSPSLRNVARMIYQNNNWSSSMQGGNSDIIIIRNWKMKQGRPFTSSEVDSKQKVVLIGATVSDKLFGNMDPIDKVIRINKIPFRVIGVLEAKGTSGFGGNSDDTVIIPYTTLMQRFYKKTYIPSIVASADSTENTELAKNEIISVLRQRHHLREGEVDDFSIRTQQDMQNANNQANTVFTLLLTAIASVSLLVGGIGIMNIMFVSVTERVREIGIRIAIGAKRKDILLQFLVESIVLSGIGGMIGIVLGVGSSLLISKIAGWPTAVSGNSIILSIAFSAAIGIFFGFYPAWRASLLDPIESLRSEL
jgi:putative ABC transport system permease protein